MRTYALICGVLGVISLGFFALTGLALIDISQGEPDVVNEWRAVKVAVLPILLFHVVAIAGFFRVAQRIKEWS